MQVSALVACPGDGKGVSSSHLMLHLCSCEKLGIALVLTDSFSG